MHERYLLFGGRVAPKGGWNDYLVSSDSLGYLISDKFMALEWCQIVDTLTNEIILFLDWDGESHRNFWRSYHPTYKKDIIEKTRKETLDAL